MNNGQQVTHINAAQTWVLAFLVWYHELHQHRALGYPIPGQSVKRHDK